MSKTVKAREHYGANSLDLTLPAEVVDEYDVNAGDIFEIEVASDDDELTLTYTRVYKSEE
ncbi:AbrB/MazE/SpoVT family DNA-binding domain-containing protein [Halovenus marina]|uniref:AbrB/MazE/SpoVT family DNA-binding domain-containing protein n=1 Tax=Halovenus marina TaxID=3396621 RepID=UPI003F56ADD2